MWSVQLPQVAPPRTAHTRLCQAQRVRRGRALLQSVEESVRLKCEEV